MEPKFYSKVEIYSGTTHYHVIKRTPENEFFGGYHYHDFFEITLYYCTDENDLIGTITVKNEIFPLRNGSVVLLNAFEPHDIHLLKHDNYERHSINLDLGFLLSLSSEATNLYNIFQIGCPNYPVTQVNKSQQSKLLSLFSEIYQPAVKNGKDLYTGSLLGQILSLFYHYFYVEDAAPVAFDMRNISTVATIIRYVNNHIDGDLSLGTLSSLVNYSPAYVSRIFHKQTGTVLSHYVLVKRIDRAKVLLANPSLSVVSVSKAVGFYNYNHFFRSFKKLVGVNPTDYRAEL